MCAKENNTFCFTILKRTEHCYCKNFKKLTTLLNKKNYDKEEEEEEEEEVLTKDQQYNIYIII